MYSYQIDEMTEAISRELSLTFGIGSPNIEKVIHSTLDLYWKDKIAITWTVEDVISVARERDATISEEDAMIILDEIHDRHDCEFGVTWNTIENALDDLLNEVEK